MNLFSAERIGCSALGVTCCAAAFKDRKTYRFTAEREQLRAEYHAVYNRWNTIRAFLIALSIWLFLVVFSAFGSMLDTVISGEDSEFNGQLSWLLPVFFCGCIALCTLLAIVGVKEKRFRQSKRLYRAREEALFRAGLRELGVPGSAAFIDVCASVRRGRKLLLQNAETSVFLEEGALCFSNAVIVVKLPRERLTITRVEKRIFSFRWTKDTSWRKGNYKQYGIRQIGDGSFRIKPHYRLKISGGTEDYEILIPCYDVQPVLELTDNQISD